MEWFKDGGWNMYVLAIMWAILVPQGILFARNADAQRLALIRTLILVNLGATFLGFSAGMASTAKFIVNHPEEPPFLTLCQGFQESTANILFGVSLCVVSWICMAIGIRRMPREVGL